MPKNVQISAQLYSFHMLPRDNAQNSPSEVSTYVNQAFPNFQAEFRKRSGTRDQITNIHWIIEKARESRKISTSYLLTM